jgi:hypothetical protein
MFAGWQTFYQLTGSVAGELIGLLFIVATLAAGRRSPRNQTGQKLFTTPTVVHLGTVVIVSALALAPGTDNNSASVLMVLGALAGVAYTAAVAISLRRNDNPTHWSDFWLYGAAPAAAYVALTAAASAAVARAPHAAYYVGLVLLLLLILGIRNAWDLVTWLAQNNVKAD